MMIYYVVVALFIKIIVLSCCYVEGVHLRNRFQWKDTIGPWEERPGHLGEGDHSQLHHVSTMLV